MEKRFCKKCLLYELAETEQYQNVYDYINNLDEDLKTPDEDYQQRLTVCKECERLINGMCNACGCFVEMRAALKKNKCPYKKW